MPVPLAFRSSRSVPIPARPVAVTYHVAPEPLTAEIVPVAEPVGVSVKSVASTSVTLSLKSTRHCTLVVLVVINSLAAGSATEGPQRSSETTAGGT